MSMILDGTSGITTPGVVNTAGETIATTLAVTGVSTFAAGTALLPALTTTGDTNTGLWFPAADTVAASTGGTERMRIDSSGNVLVGTTSASPSAPFTGLLVAGLFKTISTSGLVSNADSATLFTITTDTAYLVTVQTGNASGLSTTALVRYVSGGNPVATTTLAGDSANFVVSFSGTAVRITNNLGGIVNYIANIVRIF